MTLKNSLEEGEKPPDVSQKQYQKEYLPASFDLSQPTRRFSAPSDLDLPESPSKTILNYTINNNMYDNHRTQEQQALIRALENLSSNATTQERQPERGPVVQQLYKQKKPMSVHLLHLHTCSSNHTLFQKYVSHLQLQMETIPRKMPPNPLICTGNPIAMRHIA